ncbi:erythromycin esterase family protein [Pedobacter frigiditerrae]|uniref:erythromycin esterase family protein n=1 Tax=Pedobacter frigiditerrae TaxID=2530452 RepID=UPI00292DBDFF|nr:erythromycin esterase family protein [Pedobacter frigiditerrae]
MKQIELKKLFPFFFLFLFSSGLFAQEAEIVTKLNAIIKPINTLAPDSSFDDIDFLSGVLREKKIVALGEATHGTKEIFVYKDRLVRYLVAKLGYRAITFEADFSGLEVIDNYINGKADSAIIGNNYKPLFKWLKDFNKDKIEQDKVHIYGLEIREFSLAIDRILSLNWNISQQDKTILLGIRNIAFEKIDKQSLANFKEVCSRLPVNVYTKMLLQLIDNYQNFIGIKSKIGVRDKFMAENAIALQESIPNTKLVIWAHNGHVAKSALYNKPTMGEYLFKKYGNKYHVMATDINKGYVSVRTLVAKTKSFSSAQPLYLPEVSSDKAYEYYFSQCKFKNFILDVNKATVDNQLRSFFNQQKEMRMIGGTSTPLNKKLAILTNFDTIIYFNETNSL